MSILRRFLGLLPNAPRLIGTVIAVNGIYYTISLVGGGSTQASSQTPYAVGTRVYIEGNRIISSAPTGNTIVIDV